MPENKESFIKEKPQDIQTDLDCAVMQMKKDFPDFDYIFNLRIDQNLRYIYTAYVYAKTPDTKLITYGYGDSWTSAVNQLGNIPF